MKKVALGLSIILVFILSCTPTYIVTFSGSTGGTVSDIGGEFDEGTVISVTAQPDTGYEFQGWSDGSIQNPRSIAVTESLNLTALFSKQQFAVITSVQGEGTIQSSGSNAQGEFEYGANARFEAIPSTGWLFDSWEGDVSGTTNPISVSINAPISVRAVFKREKFDLNITVVGQGEVLESVVVQPGQYDYETQVKLTAVPETGWEFSAWSGDLASTENPVTVTVEEAQDITATFTRKKYDLTITVVGEGSVTEEIVVQPGQYDYQTQVKLTAIPETGWEFVAWSNDVDSTENPVTITINQERSLMVTFKKSDSDGDGVVDLEDLCPDTPEGETVNANGCHDVIYVDENGVTIKARETAIVGDTQEINGEIYKVVDETILREMVANNKDVSKVVTTFVEEMDFLFVSKAAFNQNISGWDVSNVTTMKGMFSDARSFNKDISVWDVSNVIDMEGMFLNAESFNKSIGNWNVSKVTKVQYMFREATSFNQDISNWDMSNKTWIGGMFYGASSFNQPLNNWDVSNTHDFSNLFRDAVSFDQPLDQWDVSKAGNNGGMDYMFKGAQLFNQDLSNWCVNQIIDSPDFFSSGQIRSDFLPIWGQCGEIYLDENGVTIKARDNAVVGQSYKISNNGEEYTVVDDAMLRNMVTNNEDLSKVVTTKISDMSNLFAEISFNQDISSWDVSNVTSMTGMFRNSDFNQSISHWDVSNVSDMSFMFSSDINDEPTQFNQPINDWDVSSVTNMRGMFKHSSFNQALNKWDVSNVNDMSAMFASRTYGIRAYITPFNQNISDWDVGSVTNMSMMFLGSVFNQSIGNWNVSNVTDMSFMFANAPNFNQNISNWNVSKVINMAAMFSDAESFNQNIGAWNTSAVKDMRGMFSGNEGYGSRNPELGGGSSFNQPIGGWDVSNVIYMGSMFSGSPFNQDISSWDVSNVTSMSGMFSESSFNQSISNWDVSNVTDMKGMFQASSFNQSIGNWNVSKVTDVSWMFFRNPNFNQDISNWDLSEVTSMHKMFAESIFNQDISGWNVSNVYDMREMFASAQNFNQDLNSWDTSNVVDCTNFSMNTPKWTLPKPNFTNCNPN